MTSPRQSSYSIYWHWQRRIILCTTEHRMSSLLFGNGTDMVHWQPSCNTRGTFDILSTCIITMLLCVRSGSGQSPVFLSGSPLFYRLPPLRANPYTSPSRSSSKLLACLLLSKNTSLPPHCHRRQAIATAYKHHRCLYHLQLSHPHHCYCRGVGWKY